MTRALFTLACAFLAGCATSSHDRAWLDGELKTRAGAATRGESVDELPADVRLADGLDEAEVTSIALWRNPALHAELSRIDAAWATLREARRPANPQLSIMGAFGPVSAVATLAAPLESLWQMPYRSRAAAREADATGEAVLMRALDLVRDARLLHAELVLASERVTIRMEQSAVAVEVARIATVRAQLGDISPTDERVLTADAQNAQDALTVAETDRSLARARLLAHLSLDDDAAHPLEVSAAAVSFDETTLPHLSALVEVARRARPDARAADFAVRAATDRTGWERSRVVSVSALVEGHWAQPDGPALRLGGRAELPLFGANPGGIGRAEAEVKRTLAVSEMVARTVTLEVTTARARLVQATRSRERFEEAVLPALEEALTMATGAFEQGDDTYLVVLDVLRRTGEARLRRADLLAEQRRATAELDRALGARLVHAGER